MPLEFFDYVYADRQIASGYDTRRDFYNWDIQALDAPSWLPAGSTESAASVSGVPFYGTRVFYRGQS